VTCGEPPEIEGGNITHTDNQLGALAYLTCHKEFILHGANVYKCGENGTWLGYGMCGKIYSSF